MAVDADRPLVRIISSTSGKKGTVELKSRPDTPDVSNLQKPSDFVHAFMLGFDTADAVALLRLVDDQGCGDAALPS
jgi:rRNA processing protein Krr1/Pno1